MVARRARLLQSFAIGMLLWLAQCGKRAAKPETRALEAPKATTSSKRSSSQDAGAQPDGARLDATLPDAALPDARALATAPEAGLETSLPKRTFAELPPLPQAPPWMAVSPPSSLTPDETAALRTARDLVARKKYAAALEAYAVVNSAQAIAESAYVSMLAGNLESADTGYRAALAELPGRSLESIIRFNQGLLAGRQGKVFEARVYAAHAFALARSKAAFDLLTSPSPCASVDFDDRAEQVVDVQDLIQLAAYYKHPIAESDGGAEAAAKEALCRGACGGVYCQVHCDSWVREAERAARTGQASSCSFDGCLGTAFLVRRDGVAVQGANGLRLFPDVRQPAERLIRCEGDFQVSVVEASNDVLHFGGQMPQLNLTYEDSEGLGYEPCALRGWDETHVFVDVATKRRLVTVRGSTARDSSEASLAGKLEGCPNH